MTNQEFTEQRERLGNRSSKIIGGYVTENLFVETFVNSEVLYTNSWWFSKTKEGRVFWFIEKKLLSELDFKIISLLQRKGQLCYQLIKDSQNWNITQISTGTSWMVEEFVNEHKLQIIPKKARNVDNSADEIKQFERCIEYYKRINILSDIERSINIEDLFLNKYFYTSNIDLFVGIKNGADIIPICLEIKFKDEFSFNGVSCFGMDCYQLEQEYSILEHAGMKLFNIILYNDSRNKERKTTTNIFDYLDQHNDLQWKYTRVSRLIKYEKYFMQSVKTSFTGTPSKSRPVYCVPMNLYTDLRDIYQIIHNEEVLDSAGQVFDYDSANKKRCPECDGQLREKDGIYGKFVGCSNFPKCKYSRGRIDGI